MTAPPLSDLRRLSRDPLDVLLAAAPHAHEHGVALLAGGRQPVLLVGDPALAVDVLVTRAGSFVKQNVIDTGGAALDARDPTDGPREHARSRRTVAPAFSRAAVAGHVELVLGCIEDVLAQPDGNRDILAELRVLAVRVVGEAILGVAPDDPRSLAGSAAGIFGAYRFVNSPRSVALALLRADRLRRSIRGERGVRSFAADAVSRAAAGATTVPALLTGGGVSADAAAARCVPIFLAGVETTAVALSWALLHVAADEALQEELRAEARAALGARRPTAGDVDTLPLARATFAEALRLYPPSWYIGRRSLVDLELGGMSVSPGTVVLVSPYVLHRDSRAFAEPDRFDPVRWREGTAEQTVDRAYLPFGLGTRRCLGERLAWVEGVLGVALAARNYRLTPLAPLPTAEPAATLTPRGGARLRFELLGS